MVYTVHIDMELGCIAPYFGIIIIGEVHSVGGTVVTNNHFFAARLGKASKKKLIIFHGRGQFHQQNELRQ